MKHTVKQDILECFHSDNPLPVIFDSPHSGHIYPADFQYACHVDTLRKIEDRYVDDLFAEAPNHNAVLLNALFPRSYIDVNRAIDDIDHTLIEGEWPFETHGTTNPTNRSYSGIGLIARLTKPGMPIYNRHLTVDEIMNRITKYYEPYHDTLCTLLDDAYYRYGTYWHINCHSMPSTSAYPKRHITMMGNTPKPSEIVIGDLDGSSATREFTHFLRDFWTHKGYRTTVNDPFKGVEIIHRYSLPTRGKNSVQIEINRSLYMDEETGAQNKNYEVIKGHCTEMIRECITFAQNHLTRLAAD